MDKVVMPELITPVLAEAIAENPEILKAIVDHQPNEEVIVGQNCTMGCSSSPTNVKLVFCNVTIGLDEAAEECGHGCGAGVSGEQAGNCRIKIGSDDANRKGDQRAIAASALNKLRFEVAVLEARKNEIEKIMRLIPRLTANRKLIARCKMELIEASEQLAAKKDDMDNLSRYM